MCLWEIWLILWNWRTMKENLRKATMHCEHLGNFLSAHNCLFSDLNPSIPSSPSQGDRLLKLFIDRCFDPFCNQGGSTRHDRIPGAAILSHTSCDLLLIGTVGTCYQIHLLQTLQRSLASTEDAWEMQDTRHATLCHWLLRRRWGKSISAVLFHLLSHPGVGNQADGTEIRYSLESLGSSEMLMQSYSQVWDLRRGLRCFFLPKSTSNYLGIYLY